MPLLRHPFGLFGLLLFALHYGFTGPQSQVGGPHDVSVAASLWSADDHEWLSTELDTQCGREPPR